MPYLLKIRRYGGRYGAVRSEDEDTVEDTDAVRSGDEDTAKIRRYGRRYSKFTGPANHQGAAHLAGLGTIPLTPRVGIHTPIT